MIAMQEGVPVIPCAVDTFGWRPWNRRVCSVVWGEPLSVADLPRNRKGYAEAASASARRSSGSGAWRSPPRPPACPKSSPTARVAAAINPDAVAALVRVSH